MKPFIALISLLVICTMMACNTTRVVKPLKAKEVMVGVDAGGPIFKFAGTSIPVPFSSVSVAYGLDSMVTLHAGANITSALFGNVHLDLGAVASLYRSQKPFLPSISGGVSTQLITNVLDGGFRVFPVLDVNMYWQYAPKHQHYLYLNYGAWFNFFKRPHNQPLQQVYFPRIALGHTFENAKMRYTLEVDYSAIGVKNGGVPLVFKGIDGHGALGVHVGVARKF